MGKPSLPPSLSCWTQRSPSPGVAELGSKLRDVNPACFLTRAPTLVIPGKAIDFSKPMQPLPKAIFMDPYEQCDLCYHQQELERKFSYYQVQIELLVPASTMTQMSLLHESCPDTQEDISACTLTSPSSGLTPSFFSIIAYNSGLSLFCRHLLIGVVCFLDHCVFLGLVCLCKRTGKDFQRTREVSSLQYLVPTPLSRERDSAGSVVCLVV